MNPDGKLETAVNNAASQDTAPATAWSSKLKLAHYERSAIIYVRQSTAHRH